MMRTCFKHDAYDPLSVLAMLVWPGDTTLKASRDGSLVGFVCGGPARGQDFAWIIALGVHPGFRRQGLATRLLAECETRLVDPRVRLTVRAGNAGAIGLYRKAGYVEIGRLRRYYSGGEDGLEMEKFRQ